MVHHLRFFFQSRDSLIVGLVFCLNSLMFGNWVTRIPNVKELIGLSESQLGLALLGAPAGALIIMPFSGWLIARLDLGKTIWASSFLLSLSLLFLASAKSFVALTASLFFFGFVNSLMDISMNAAAAITERKVKNRIMSTCHGMWSVGAMIGSGVGSLMVGFGIQTFHHLLGTTIFVALVLLIFRKDIFSYHEVKKPGDRVIALPNFNLLLLAIMAFCIMICEGGVADWSAVYMRDTLQANSFLTGIAYSGYALLMTVGRMMGDWIIPKVGKRRVALWGGIISAFGLGLALIIGQPLVAILGFSIAGFGFSCIVPVLFMSAANEPGYSSGTGIASVTTIGYAGFLVGPPVIGFLAEAYTLSMGLGLIVFCSVMVSMLSFVVKFK